MSSISEILKGIDTCDIDYGWWETSTGAYFGAKKLNELNSVFEKVISEYKEKVIAKDRSIKRIDKMLSLSRKGNASIDVEDLYQERMNARRDRQLYVQFIEELESLL